MALVVVLVNGVTGLGICPSTSAALSVGLEKGRPSPTCRALRPLQVGVWIERDANWARGDLGVSKLPRLLRPNFYAVLYCVVV